MHSAKRRWSFRTLFGEELYIDPATLSTSGSSVASNSTFNSLSQSTEFSTSNPSTTFQQNHASSLYSSSTMPRFASGTFTRPSVNNIFTHQQPPSLWTSSSSITYPSSISVPMSVPPVQENSMIDLLLSQPNPPNISSFTPSSSIDQIPNSYTNPLVLRDYQSTPWWEPALEQERSEDYFATDEEKAFNERIRFYVIPSGGEKAYNIMLPLRSEEYNVQRVEELETLLEKHITIRMNADSCNVVTWRQNMCFTLPAGETANLFFEKRKNSAEPVEEKKSSKLVHWEGKQSHPIVIHTHVYKWKSDMVHKLPALATNGWHLKKWEGKEVIFRAMCVELTLLYRPELDIIRAEFVYRTQYFNTKMGENGMWQDC